MLLMTEEGYEDSYISKNSIALLLISLIYNKESIVHWGILNNNLIKR
jgi:hypothetical protein